MKVRVTVSISDENKKWIDAMIEESIFANVSHAVEYSLKQSRKNHPLLK